MRTTGAAPAGAAETFPGRAAGGKAQPPSLTRIGEAKAAAGGRSTVYGVRLRVDNKRDRLKPGMPADVTFDESSE